MGLENKMWSVTCVIGAWVWAAVCVLCDQGLSILLNTCNLRTADKYTEFADHVTCVSLKREESVPVVNRRWVYPFFTLSVCVILYGRLCVFASVIVIDVSVVITVLALNHYRFGTHNINSLSSFWIFAPPDLLCILFVAFKLFCLLYQVVQLSSHKNVNKYLYLYLTKCLQCFDTVGWASERAPGL